MWWCQVLFHRTLLARSVIATMLIATIFQITSKNSYAEHPAIPGEYVITPRLIGADVSKALSTNSLNSVSAESVRSLGSALLVRDTAPKVAADQVDGAQEALSNEDFCIRMIKSGLVRDCSPNYILSADVVPNDPQFPNLWGLSAGQGMNASGAWELSTGSNTMVVAIIDTGVDTTHPDLVGNIWTNSNEIPGNGIDDDNNGYVDDVHGINAATGSGNPKDDNGHGSHCAGTIGARGNNGIGVAGVNWNVQIMPLKFLDANGSGSLSNAIVAINYMVMMKNRGVNVRISSNSWGGGGYSQAMYDAIARARDAGIIFVAAAGNESNDNDAAPSYPAGYDLANIVSVAAIDSNSNLASFSNYGASSVHIAAPGVGILSTYKNGGYATLSGTSMATPHVAGALALLLGYLPSLSMTQAITRLYETAVVEPTLDGLTKYSRKANVARLLTGESTPIPLEPAVPLCSYTAEEIAFAPDHSADAKAPVLQADESNFTSVALPFTLPYYGRNVTGLILSPNGVIYTKQAPTGMDYQNSSRAPLNSVAALHSDLIEVGDPLGVRFTATDTSATVYYRAKHYSYQNNSELKAWVTFFSNGIIEEHLEIDDSGLEQFIRTRSTIGVTGPSNTASTTVGYNSSTIRNGLAVRYTPICNGTVTPPASVNSVGLKGVDAQGKLYSFAARGRALNVALQGAGTGTIQLQPVLDGVKCSGSISATLIDGVANLVGSVPGTVHKTLAIRVTSSKARSKIAVRERFKRSKNRSHQVVRRASVRQLTKACSKLLSSLQTK